MSTGILDSSLNTGENEFVSEFLLTLVFAIMTGLLSSIRIFLPWTPVPITAQTIPVLMAGFVLKRYWGGISMLFYLLLGVSGLNWFSVQAGGLSVLCGPTAGYLMGFVITGFLAGFIKERYSFCKSYRGIVLMMIFFTLFFIYLPGLINLKFWTSRVNGSNVSIITLIKTGVLPFIPGDLIKILAASSLSFSFMKEN